jgi:hypothetical protein
LPAPHNGKKNYPWEAININKISSKINLSIPKFPVPEIISKKRSFSENRQKESDNFYNDNLPDKTKFYLDFYAKKITSPQYINTGRKFSEVQSFKWGIKYTHFFDNYWRLFSDSRITLYRKEKNDFLDSQIKLDLKELYLISDGFCSNQFNVLAGRKVLTDARSWYYHTSLDTIGFFNKWFNKILTIFVSVKKSSFCISSII